MDAVDFTLTHDDGLRVADLAQADVVIVGAGKGGRALLEMFAGDPTVTILGIADLNSWAPGLELARRLVELMGGRIWVESEPGRVSTFFFTARVRRQDKPSARPASVRWNAPFVLGKLDDSVPPPSHVEPSAATARHRPRSTPSPPK